MVKESKIYKFFDNFWYHYKWVILMVLLFTVFIVVATVQSCTGEKFDMTVMYAGPEVVTVQDGVYITKAFENLNLDDGVPKHNVALRDIYLPSSEEYLEKYPEEVRDGLTNGINASNITQNKRVFEQEIISGNSVICMLSPTNYETVKAADGFLPLAEVLTYVPENANDEYSVFLSETDFGKLEGLSRLPDNTLLCIRRPATMPGAQSKRAYEMCKLYFKLAYEYRANTDSAQ